MIRSELAWGGVCVGLLTLAQVVPGAVRTEFKAPVGLSQREREALEASAVASLFGEFRSSLADFLWLEADKYLHNGVTVRGMLESEKTDTKVGKVTGTEEHDHHENETTVIPSKASDWRMVLGEVERETQPYQNMEGHAEKDPKETLPLFPAMTLANPHFVQGYVNGAARMIRMPGKLESAITFLKEGERNNPDSIEIQAMLCEVYLVHKQAPLIAEPHGLKALSLAKARDRKTLTEDETLAYSDAYRWLILLYRNAADKLKRRGEGDKAKPISAIALALSKECLTQFPDDPTAHKYLSEHPGE